MRSVIVYEDKQLLVIHKPAGLATQSADVCSKDVVSEIRGHLKTPYLGIVHRLDQPVEGLLVMAKDKKTAAALSRQLEKGILSKEYTALAADCRSEGSGALKKGMVIRAENLIKKDNRTKKAMVRDLPNDNAYAATEKDWKKAVLELVIEDVFPDDGSLRCRIRIETGRFHQIRAQMSHMGLPLAGDLKYGNEKSALISERVNAAALALIADRIGFEHPVTHKRMEFSIDKNDLPECFMHGQ